MSRGSAQCRVADAVAFLDVAGAVGDAVQDEAAGDGAGHVALILADRERFRPR